ncbi:Lymphoid-restricted membrane protein [Varanus komodoensis]|nr:Lymphoid-restricted membrane protein [Varanus komodoensis]
MSSNRGRGKRHHHPVNSLCRKLQTIKMMDQASNPALQIPKFQSKNFDSPQGNMKKNLEEIWKRRTLKTSDNSTVPSSDGHSLSPLSDNVFSPCSPVATPSHRRISDIRSETFSVGRNKEKACRPWLDQAESCSPCLLDWGELGSNPPYGSTGMEQKDTSSQEWTYLTSSPDLLSQEHRPVKRAFQAPVNRRLSLGRRLLTEAKDDESDEVSLICEEDLLTTMFSACDVERRDKTEVLLVGRLGFGEGELNLVLNGVALPLRDKVHSLGVLLDPELSLEAQVTAVARSAFFQLRLIHQLRPYLEDDCLATVTHVLVTSRLDFCNALYMGLPLKTVRILQLVQNRAAGLLMGTGRYVHMTPVLRQLHWLPIEVRAQFKVLVMTFKALNGLGPGYLKERLRKVAVSKLVDFLRFTTSRSSEDSQLEELCNMLDPEQRDISMDLETYHAIMKEWIEDCRRNWETSDLIACIADLQFNNQKLQEENGQLKLALDTMEEANNRLTEEGGELRNQIKSFQQSVAQVKTLQRELEESKNNLGAAEEKGLKMASQTKQLEKENQSLIFKISSLQEENIRTALDADGFQKKIAELSRNMAELQMQVHLYENMVGNKDTSLLQFFYAIPLRRESLDGLPRILIGLLLKDMDVQELKSTLKEYTSVIETLRAEKNKLVKNVQRMQQELISNGINFPLMHKLNSSNLEATNSLHCELELAEEQLEVGNDIHKFPSTEWSLLDESMDREVLLLLQEPERVGERFKAAIQNLQELFHLDELSGLSLLQGSDAEANGQEAYEKRLGALRQDLEARRTLWLQKLELLEAQKESLDKGLVKMVVQLRKMRTEQLHLKKALSSRQCELASVTKLKEDAEGEADILRSALQEARNQLEEALKRVEDQEGHFQASCEEAHSLQKELRDSIAAQERLQGINLRLTQTCQLLEWKVKEQSNALALDSLLLGRRSSALRTLKNTGQSSAFEEPHLRNGSILDVMLEEDRCKSCSAGNQTDAGFPSGTRMDADFAKGDVQPLTDVLPRYTQWCLVLLAVIRFHPRKFLPLLRNALKDRMIRIQHYCTPWRTTLVRLLHCQLKKPQPQRARLKWRRHAARLVIVQRRVCPVLLSAETGRRAGEYQVHGCHSYRKAPTSPCASHVPGRFIGKGFPGRQSAFVGKNRRKTMLDQTKVHLTPCSVHSMTNQLPQQLGPRPAAFDTSMAS